MKTKKQSISCSTLHQTVRFSPQFSRTGYKSIRGHLISFSRTRARSEILNPKEEVPAFQVKILPNFDFCNQRHVHVLVLSTRYLLYELQVNDNHINGIVFQHSTAENASNLLTDDTHFSLLP